MFGLNPGGAVAPIVTFVVRVFDFNGNPPAPALENFTTMLEEFKCTDQTTAACLGSIIVTIAQDAINAAPTVPSLAGIFDTGAAGAIDHYYGGMLATIGANPPANDEQKLIVKVSQNLPNAGRWIIDLCNAAKKKKLEEGNVEGYFASLGNETIKAVPIMRFINDISFFFPDSVGNAAFRNLLTPGVWTTYRLTRVSAGKILFEILGIFRDLGITANGDAVEQAITASRNSPHDVTLAGQIPRKYLAYGAIYHIASGTPIDKWHQGNKAIDDLPSQRVRFIRDVFSRYLEIKNNAAGLGAANDLPALLNLVRNCW
jgi:hypothetical protein